jgi:hypothetical protein
MKGSGFTVLDGHRYITGAGIAHVVSILSRRGTSTTRCSTPTRRTAACSGLVQSSGAADRLAPSSVDESELPMAIGIYISPESFPVDKYDSTLKDLENAGAGAPAGRLYHVAMKSPGGVHVFDIWESKEAFEAFGATLLPILSAAGVDPGEPMISEVHNVITA